MIAKPPEHDIDRAGKRLLREALEQLGWVVNEVQEDYGIDYNVQVFDGKAPTGAWFHIQLKSSASSDYAADHTFVSQHLSVDHAQHYTLEMREPVLVIHADVTSNRVYWYAPQLDRQLATDVSKTAAKSITVRIPTRQRLPATAPELLSVLDGIQLALANRIITSASTQFFAESLKYLPDQQVLYRAFQAKGDTIKLRRIAELYREGKFDEARPRANTLLLDPDSTVETKFWARMQLQSIDYREATHAGKPQGELPKVLLAHAKALQQLTASGPNYLKFYSLIARQAAELHVLTHQTVGLFMALHQHLHGGGDPMMVLGLYARRAALTKRIIAKYNQCVRLTRYAVNYPNRWMLGRALINIANATAPYLVTLRYEENLEAEHAFAQSALQICKVAASICDETADTEGLVLTILGALATTHSTDSDAYLWAVQLAQRIPAPDVRKDALLVIERDVKRWMGERVEGDYHGDTIWQITQNIATSLGIDLSDETAPLVQSLRIAAKDNSPERVLATCEHLLVSLGAAGPRARFILHRFNVGTAGSKVIHCTLHNYHVEGREIDTAYDEFRRTYCDLCPDKKPRPVGWRYTENERRELTVRHRQFVSSLEGTTYGFRDTDED